MAHFLLPLKNIILPTYMYCTLFMTMVLLKSHLDLKYFSSVLRCIWVLLGSSRVVEGFMGDIGITGSFQEKVLSFKILSFHF